MVIQFWVAWTLFISARGGFWGDSGIRTPADSKGPPFLLFTDIHFWLTDPKVLKAPLAPIYTNFEGGARAKKTHLFLPNFSKNASKRLFGLFFFLIWTT